MNVNFLQSLGIKRRGQARRRVHHGAALHFAHEKRGDQPVTATARAGELAGRQQPQGYRLREGAERVPAAHLAARGAHEESAGVDARGREQEAHAGGERRCAARGVCQTQGRRTGELIPRIRLYTIT